MALSKSWTLEKLESIIRTTTGEITPQMVLSQTIRDYLNVAITDTVELLNGATAPDYGTTANLTLTSNTADISALKIDKIIKIVDSVNGIIPAKKDLDFESLVHIKTYEKSIFYNHFGETIYFFKGSQISSYGTTVTLYYYRQPTLFTTATTNISEYADIKDKHIPLIIAMVKGMVYEQLKSAPPESLTNLIEQKIQLIKTTNLEEDTVKAKNAVK